MSGAKYTPANWKVIETHDLPWSGDHVADLSNGLMVVPVVGGLGDPLADAHLIAAAPELLEALKDAAEALEFLQNRMGTRVNPPTLENARAAIAKAQGVQAC